MCEGQRIDGYILIKEIGKGGNAIVWEVKDSNEDIFAMKLLKDNKAGKKSFIRFQDEIKIMTDYREYKGMMPILDIITNKEGERFGYTMPIMDKINDFLSNNKLENIVEAFIEIGKILTPFHIQDISHRDIKPENLYFSNGEWYIGDWGLVDFPEKENISKDEKKIGPVWTMAPEMKRDPERSDGKLADVYSLAKTLWIILSKEKMGFEGRYDLNNESISLKNYIDNDYLFPIEDLLRECTNDSPLSRPNISTVVDRLQQWKDEYNNFMQRNYKQWENKNSLLMNNLYPDRMEWTNINNIITVLKHFSVIESLNHAFLPGGGGLDLTDVSESNEINCIELNFNDSVYIIKPKRLIYENFNGDIQWNYLRIENANLHSLNKDTRNTIYEELTELAPGKYTHFSYIHDYHEESLPKSVRTVSRILNGDIVIFARSSLYNLATGKYDAYDGRHAEINTDQFRQFIDKFVKYDNFIKYISKTRYRIKELINSFNNEKKKYFDIIILARSMYYNTNAKHINEEPFRVINMSEISFEDIMQDTLFEKPLYDYLDHLSIEELSKLVNIMVYGRDYYSDINNDYENEIDIKIDLDNPIVVCTDKNEYILYLLGKTELYLYIYYGIVLLNIFSNEELSLVFRIEKHKKEVKFIK